MPAPRDRLRPRFQPEGLEQRIALAFDIAVIAATTTDSQSVLVDYTISGDTTPASVPLGIYRSADASFSASSDQLVGGLLLSGSQLTVGDHEISIPIPDGLVIDPSRKFVLAVADPANTVAETNEGNNVASFKKLLVGVVTHGAEPSGTLPFWVGEMATTLQGEGYDAAIPFNWAAASNQANPTIVPQQAGLLTNQVIAAAGGLTIGANDVVDVHMIGFGRGAGVVTLAGANLGNVGVPTPLASGFLKLTLLDPHPARNDGFVAESASTGPFGRLSLRAYRNFQSKAQDPALTIPANADYAEAIYQRTPYDRVNDPVSGEGYFNPWGSVPIGGNTAVTSYFDITPLASSHTAVRQYYQQIVAPNLGLGGATFPFAPNPVPSSTPVTPAMETGRTDHRGYLYELNRLRKGTNSIQTARHLLDNISGINQQALGGRLTAASNQLNRFVGYVQANSGRSILIPVAEGLSATARYLKMGLNA